MAYTVSTTSAPFRGFFVSIAASLGDRAHRYSLYRKTLVELSRLSDRELADIGVGRAAIETIAREHAYGK